MILLRVVLYYVIAWPVVSILPALHKRQRDSRVDQVAEKAAGLPCQSPVARAPVVFPEELLTSAKDVEGLDMHSGYVNVTGEDYLFYWFVRADASTPADVPVLVWSNGGPGCSAMEGATTELGPLLLYMAKESGSGGFNGKLSRNPYAWNQEVHLLFVDQPRYVGYSCGTGAYTCSSREAGLDMVTFLRGWRNLFPEISNPKFILASESYGGHYVPAWTEAILDYNEKASDRIPIVGIAIGNGIVNSSVQNVDTFVEWGKQEGLLDMGANVASEHEARSLLRESLGYEPNYYDYRLTNVECCACFSYNYSTWSHWLLKTKVREALNVCGSAGEMAHGGCSGGCISFAHSCYGGFDYHDVFDYSGALSRALDQGIKITLFYGKQDTACDYVGGYAMASSLTWKHASQWKLDSLRDIFIGGSKAGQMKSLAGLTWMQIDGAGHMVPINNAAAAYHALKTLLPEAPEPDRAQQEVGPEQASESHQIPLGESNARKLEQDVRSEQRASHRRSWRDLMSRKADLLQELSTLEGRLQRARES